jgi:DNA-binding NarL/FixJ family response regulator
MLLSSREADVLRGICEGKSNKEIARDHDLQEVTVKLHVKTMGRKLGAKNRTHAAMIARDRKLV